ncbi:hypothetical protein BSKO_13639 [Bryopsis sp. KO-2023]|nr:hypothetical protein BSKO_13639 [Bryopsis sp. KO-2023]
MPRSCAQYGGAFTNATPKVRFFPTDVLRNSAGPARRHDRVVAHSLGDDIKNFFDSMAFEKWAPRSSQAWRLGQSPTRSATNDAAKKRRDELFKSLDESIKQSRDEEEEATRRGAQDISDVEDPLKSISESTDEEFASALNAKIGELAESSWDSEDGEALDEYEGDLSGQELRELIFEKFGKFYDAEFARRNFAGKSLVSLNIMWVHLQQRSFPMTDGDYNEKLDGMAYLLNTWNRAEKVRKFLKAPRKSAKGLPSKPIVGCAVSIQLDLEDEVIEEWFKQR